MGIKSSLIVGKFDSVTNEAARAIVVITDEKLGWQIRQTGGIAPGVYVAIAVGTGIDKWHRTDHVLSGFERIQLKSPTENGETLPVDVVTLVAASAIGDPGNPSFFLPTTVAIPG